MKSNRWLATALLSVGFFAAIPTFADESMNNALAMCDCRNNPDLCRRLQESNGLERDPNHRGNQEHTMGRAPAGMSQNMQMQRFPQQPGQMQR